MTAIQKLTFWEEGNDPDNEDEGSPATSGTQNLSVNDRVQNAKLPLEREQDLPSPPTPPGQPRGFRKQQQILPSRQAALQECFNQEGSPRSLRGTLSPSSASTREPRLQHPGGQGDYLHKAPPPHPHGAGGGGGSRRKKPRIPQRLPPRGAAEEGAPAPGGQGPQRSPASAPRSGRRGVRSRGGIPELRPLGPPQAGLPTPAKTPGETGTMSNRVPRPPRPERGRGRRRHLPSHPRGHTPPPLPGPRAAVSRPPPPRRAPRPAAPAPAPAASPPAPLTGSCPSPGRLGPRRSETRGQGAAAAGAAAQYGEPRLPQWSSGNTTGVAQYS
nr:basic proline-rich protein-like [Equus asinus]